MQNLSLFACSEFTGVFAEEWGTSSSQVAYLSSVTILALGWFNVLVLPLANLHGTRLLLTISIAICSASYIWGALATGFYSFLGSRLLCGIGATLIESVGPLVIEQVWFVHERGAFLGLYFAAVFASASVGPFLSAVFATTVGWRNFFWMMLAISMALQVAFLFYRMYSLY